MKNPIPVTAIIILIIAVACNSEDNKGFLWEKETGHNGSAYVSHYTSDSLYLFAGSSSGKPAAVKTTVSGRLIYRYDGDEPGRYTSVTEDTSGIYIAGSSNGKIIISRITNRFSHIWTFTYDSSTGIESAKILKWNEDKYIVVGGDRADSLRYDSFVILIINRDGERVFLAEPGGGTRQTVSDIVTVDQDIVAAVTRKNEGGKSQAVIARYSTTGDLIWEKELYNNPEFGASTSALERGDDGTIYATGLTELPDGDGLLTSSWVAGFTPAGKLLWKRYLENSNAGVDLFIKDGTDLMVLNRNCGIINHISLPDGSVTDRSVLYYACDPSDSEVDLRSVNVLPCGDYLVTGSRLGKFYYSRYKVTGTVD